MLGKLRTRMTGRRRLWSAGAALAVGIALYVTPGGASAAVGGPCLVSGPGPSCVGTVTFSSYAVSDYFRPVQGVAGSGVQPDITVSFSSYVSGVRVWANDPDYAGSSATVFLAGFGWLPVTDITGDGKPGVFSIGGGGGLLRGPFTQVRLHSASGDYVNWRVEYTRWGNPNGQWCSVNTRVTTCDSINATVSPFYQGSGFDPFQALAGTGAQAPIQVNFGGPAATVDVTAVDPDYGTNRMEAYAADGTLLGTTYFTGDNNPGVTTTSTKSITDARGISRVVLISDPADYVVFQGLTAYPII